MPRYHFSCTFTYRGSPEALHHGLAEWLRDLGDTAKIKLKSCLTAGVPSIEFFRGSLSTFPDDSIWLAFQLIGLGGSGRGRLAIARPSEKPESSQLELQFSVNAKLKGLFASGEQVRRALISAASAFEAESGRVEAEDFSDEESSRKYAVFQSIRDHRVPVNIEWMNVLRADVWRSIGWDLAKLPSVPGVRVGQERGYVWILLSEAPFSYKGNVGTEAQRRIEEALELAAKQQGR